MSDARNVYGLADDDERPSSQSASSPTLDPVASQHKQPDGANGDGLPHAKPDTRASDLEQSGIPDTLQTSVVPPNLAAASGRYLLTGFHARGGMGEVWRCRDATIGREVALKRLVSDRAAARERFLCEAQVTGQLEHPGIVPVHDLGFDDSGKPFYVMTLVRGQTLKSAIEEFHGSANNAKTPRELGRLRLLKIFLDLCNAVAYAHSRGVIHRDLKPENVMLGGYGETVVLDWGLAKLKGQPDLCGTTGESGSGSGNASGGASGGSPPTRLSISGQSAQTEDGSILGSPLYMPPEMAEGRTADADQRTDVYLLGATLYEILTGRPPREGHSRDAILEMARTAPPVPPRKCVPHTPRALEAICLKAMSRSKAQRYESAVGLAEDIQRFLAGEAVSARPDRLVARAWRWAKRYRRGLARMAVAAALLASASVAIVLYHDAARAMAREQARTDVAEVIRLAGEARFYAASVDAPDEVTPYYNISSAEAAARAATAAAQRWGPSLDGFPLGEERDRVRRELATLSLLLAQVKLRESAPPGPDVLTLLERANALGAGDTRAAHRIRAAWYALSGRPQEEAAEKRLLAAPNELPQSGHDLFLQAEAARLESSPAPDDSAAVDVAAQRRARASNLNAAVTTYQAALRLDPTDYWSRLQIGRCYLALDRGPEAVEALGACIALRPSVPWGYTTRGLALALLRRFDEAAADLDRALQLDPGCTPARLNRGVLYRLQGRRADAIAEFRGLRASQNPPPEASIYLAQLLLAERRPGEALECLERLEVPGPRLTFAASLRAQAQLMLGRRQDALRELDGAVAASGGGSASAPVSARRGHLLRLIAAELPRDAEKIALDLARAELTDAVGTAPSVTALADLGAVLHRTGRSTDAVAVLTRAAALSPNDPQLLINRGWAHEAVNDLDDAGADFSAALALAPQSPEALAGAGYIAARQRRPIDAQQHASLALLHGGDDYLILHNVACIYAQLSVLDPAREREHQDAAMAALTRAVAEWRHAASGPDELELIRLETAFPTSFRARPDFKQLLGI